MLPFEEVFVDLAAQDAEEEFELAVCEARGGVAFESGGLPGVLDMGDHGGEGVFGDGEGVAHDVGDDHHADDSVEEFAQLGRNVSLVCV